MGFTFDRNCGGNKQAAMNFCGRGKAHSGKDASRKQRSCTRHWTAIGGGHLMPGRQRKERAAIIIVLMVSVNGGGEGTATHYSA